MVAAPLLRGNMFIEYCNRLLKKITNKEILTQKEVESFIDENPFPILSDSNHHVFIEGLKKSRELFCAVRALPIEK